VGSRMFPFITCTWNLLGGECKHGCRYCWARALARKNNMAKYFGEPRLIEKEMQRQFKADDFVFVCDMLDLLGEWVPSDLIKVILGKIASSLGTFLLLTKNPKCYLELLDFLPMNVVLGCTIESDISYSEVSKAPSQFQRLYWMTKLAEVERIRSADGRNSHKLFVAIEPILAFDLRSFSNILCNWIKPWAVAVGYDNYRNKLSEPPLEKTLQLIDRLEKAGITIYRKTLREAWNEQRN